MQISIECVVKEHYKLYTIIGLISQLSLSNYVNRKGYDHQDATEEKHHYKICTSSPEGPFL